ncbi:MAG: NAD(+)/NADH kinase [Oscillospiraceae bacterium]|nr:NAD(+)/NADH kinase [Oscillospiraceae bacterium]
MNVLLIPHPFRGEAAAFSARIAQVLEERGHTVCALPESLPALRQAGVSPLPFAGNANLAAVIGGDGTVLHSVRSLLAHDLPIWAVNYGHIGYLTDCEPENAFDALQNILAGNCQTETRILLEGEIEGPSGQNARFTALNEAVIHRSALSRALKLELSVNHSPLQTFSADGLIVATPTGSTAYNLSAGGPILMPGSENLVITPVCPYMLGGSSIVVSGNDTVGVRVSLPPPEEDGSDRLPMIVVDGCEKIALRGGEHITVRRSETVVRLVRTRQDSFYRTLQKKLAQNL